MKFLDTYYHFIEESRFGTLVSLLESITVAVIIALIIRQSAVSTFIIPTESMNNTIHKGDFLVGTKFTWGAEIPFTHRRMPNYGKVRYDDVIIFKTLFPPYNDYVKRCVGRSGDTIVYQQKQLTVNSKVAGSKGKIITNDSAYSYERDTFGPYTVPSKGDTIRYDSYNIRSAVFFANLLKQEFPYDTVAIKAQFDIEGDVHDSLVIPSRTINPDSICTNYWDYLDITKKLDRLNTEIIGANISLVCTVTKNDKAIASTVAKSDYYFMMGDNRDNSVDSRYFGFVSYKMLKARPSLVLVNFPLTGLLTKNRRFLVNVE